MSRAAIVTGPACIAHTPRLWYLVDTFAEEVTICVRVARGGGRGGRRRDREEDTDHKEGAGRHCFVGES